MKILITGIAGFLGSKLAEWLILNTNHTILGIDNLSGGYKEHIDKQSICEFFDLVDLEKVDLFFNKHKPDIIYHFAAYAAEGLSPFIRKFNYENNLIASVNLITCSIKYKINRFVFTSSMAVYGDKYKAPFEEFFKPEPCDPYGIAKFSVEQDLKVAYKQHNLKYTIIRPHNFYGKNQNIWDKYRNVLGIWMYQIMNNKRPTIYGDGNQKRAFSYIDDCLEPLWNASQNDKCIDQIINIGGIKEYSINDACQILLKITKSDLKPIYLEERFESKYAWSSWEKSVKLLNFKHKTELEEGLYKTWEWVKKQPIRERKKWNKYELNEKIYSYWNTDY